MTLHQGMLKALVDGVEVVSYEATLDYNKYGYLGKIEGEWGPYEPATEIYDDIRFVTYDTSMEEERYVWAARKEDLVKVFTLLRKYDENYRIDCSLAASVVMLEHIMGSFR